ncbi:hypothetical protein [Sphingomonas phage Birtae]|nr:hypothetical protein [Sphingomonas phage Birtae]
MWFLAALFVVSFAATLLLTPKVKVENARASSLNDLDFPQSDEGGPIPLILGKVRQKGPNTLWAGDFKAVPIKKKQKTGLFSSKKVIVGYEYFVGLQLGLGIGPLTLHRIWMDKEEVWSGTANVDGTAIAINKPNLFGGKEKGGGFVGTLRFFTGSWTQAISAYLSGKIGAGDVPAYRGTAHLVFEQPNIGEANQLRAMAFELSRYTNGLALGGGMNMIGEDLNPMELLYQAFTLDWGGLDVTPDLLDLDSLRACAATLFAEGNGMSICVATANGGKEIATEVIRQTDGLMYQDPLTGKIIFKLIRNDYDIDELPVFDESNVITVRNFTSKLWEDTINQVRVTYTNRDKKYEDGSAMVQDLANINAQGRVRSITQSYPGVNVGALAVELATRDLAQGSVPLLSASLEMNRDGAALRPGDVFLWAWDAFGIERVVMRVKNFDLGALNDNRIAVECAQDDFAIDLTVFAPPQSEGQGITPPNVPALPSPTRFVTEAPMFFAEASGMSLAANSSVILVAAEAPAGSDEYDIYTSSDGGANYGLSEGGVLYTPKGTLSNAITASANLSTGIIPSVTIAIDSDDLEANTAAEIAQGSGLFFIGAELFAHEGLTDNGDGTMTLSNVRRALLDTIPTAHAIGSNVFFIVGDNVVDDQFGFTSTVRVKVAPKTFSDAVDVTAAPYDSITLNKRTARPMRPANMKFDGGAAFAPPANALGSHTVSWANRNRTSLVVRSIVDATNEYEEGQQTIFRYRKNGGAWTAITAAPGATSITFDAGAVGGDVVDYELYATRDGLDSFSKWTATAGAASAGGSNPDTGGTAPPDTTPPYVTPPSVTSKTITAAVALAANDLVNVYSDGGAFKVRKADAATGREAHGFVKDVAAANAQVVVYFEGSNDALAGLTPGPKYLSDTPGLIASAPPAGAGKIVQRVGVATAAGVFIFEPGEPIGLV